MESEILAEKINFTQAIRERGMHFSILDANDFTPEEAAEIMGRIADMKAGKMESHLLIEV
ncbi:MAG TPA: hypothetical protein DCZ91_12225 [Lachnospiraceae bacterium]|nr:hypothetical protein [Lachnospiraceae bacterium]